MIVNWLPARKRPTNTNDILIVRGISMVRRAVACEAGGEGCSPGSATKCWITCHRQALLIPWTVVLSPVKYTFQRAHCQGPGWWALVREDDCAIGARPHLLKRARSPKVSLFPSAGRAMAVFWDSPSWSIFSLRNASGESEDELQGKTWGEVRRERWRKAGESLREN